MHLRVSAVTKRFGAFTALDAVSLEVEKGRLVCFLGPSGCGKTTLLRVIAGLEAQDAGSIEIAGRDVSHLPPAQRDFGIVFQSYALFPNLTVTQNVGYGLVNRRMGRRQIAERVSELLALVGMPEQGTKYPAQLSGGQQQRVALARALASSPSLLLLDEPLSALDARVRVRLRDEIKTLQRRLGITTIMVTHDQEEALAMADRIVVMNRGRVEQVGTPAETYGRPASAFVADFVGAMNMLDAVVAAPGRCGSARWRSPATGSAIAPRAGASGSVCVPRRCAFAVSSRAPSTPFPSPWRCWTTWGRSAGQRCAPTPRVTWRSCPTSPPTPCATSASARARR